MTGSTRGQPRPADRRVLRTREGKHLSGSTTAEKWSGDHIGLISRKAGFDSRPATTSSEATTIRKILAAFLCAALLFPVIVSPSAAAPLDRPVATAAAPAAPADCTDELRANYHAGMFKDVYNVRVYGIEARINPPDLTAFNDCNGWELAYHNGPSSWVALQPGAESDAGHGPILQIGITNCKDSSGVSYCQNGGAYRAFYAVKGCGGALVTDLGAIDGAIHIYRIQSVYISGITYMRGYIDGVQKFSFPQSYFALTCWIHQDTAGVWAGELWDGGDSYGNGGAGLWQVATLYRVINGAWVPPQWDANSGCHVGPADSDNSNHVCDVTAADDFKLYSVPN